MSRLSFDVWRERADCAVGSLMARASDEDSKDTRASSVEPMMR